MSEYMIDGALLTNIAGAVRAVDGSSNTLTPEQMRARLAAVKSSIDAAFSALTAKEVEVPSGSNIHGLADLIATIKVGVSAPGLAKAATGTVTTSVTRLSKLEVTHGLGVAPDFAMLYVETDNFNKRGVMGSIIFKLSDGHDLYINAGKSSNGAARGVYFSPVSGWTDTNLNETKVTFASDLIMSGSNSSTTVNFDTYSTYRWIAGVYA